MKLFAYWHTSDYPPLVKKCLTNWHQINSQFEIIDCNPDNIDQYIDKFRPLGFELLSHSHQCDWIRLKLLSLYGGVYCDVTTVFLEPVDQWCDKTADLNAFLSFDQRIMSFFLACFDNLDLIKVWLEEATFAIEYGIENYTKKINQELDHNIKSYFWVQLALIKVLNDTNNKYKLNLFYDKNILPSINQMNNTKPESLFKLIKLNHHKRNWLDIYLKQNKEKINNDSILSWINYHY